MAREASGEQHAWQGNVTVIQPPPKGVTAARVAMQISVDPAGEIAVLASIV